MSAFWPDHSARVLPALRALRRDASPKVRKLAMEFAPPPNADSAQVAAWASMLQEVLLDPTEDEEARCRAAGTLSQLGLPGARALAGAFPRITAWRVRLETVHRLIFIPHELMDNGIYGSASFERALERLAKRFPQHPTGLFLLSLPETWRLVETISDERERELARKASTKQSRS